MEQLAEIVRSNCARLGLTVSDLLPEFVAESLLTWTYSDRSYEEIEELIMKLF